MEIRQFRVVLRAKSYDSTTAFYGQILGLRRIDEWESGGVRGALFQAGPGVIEVLGRSAATQGSGRDELFDYQGPHHEMTITLIVPLRPEGLRGSPVPRAQHPRRPQEGRRRRHGLRDPRPPTASRSRARRPASLAGVVPSERRGARSRRTANRGAERSAVIDATAPGLTTPRALPFPSLPSPLHFPALFGNFLRPAGSSRRLWRVRLGV